MAFLLRQFVKGISLRGETSDSTENVEGSLFHNSTDARLRSYIQGAVREVVTNSQIQTLTNKIITASDNVIIVSSSNPNLSSTELNAALSELQTDIDVVDTNIYNHLIDAVDAHQASAISVVATGNLNSTTAQAALVELQQDIDVIDTNIYNHLIDAVDAHDASSISVTASGNLSSITVQAALVELQGDINTNASGLSSHILASDPHPQYETSAEAQTKVNAHANRVDNPHSVTKTQVGLSNVDNTSDANKPISTATQIALNLKVNSNTIGQINGIASLDGTGKVPAAQLPSYVDDVLEVANFSSLPVTGESGKAYITLDNNKVYRWSGTVYVEISPSAGSIWGAITGSLVNQTDLQSALDAKANSVHTHVAADITNFNESVDDRVSSLIVAGANISATYNDLANTLTIASTVAVITDHTALTNIGTNSHTVIDSHIASTSNPHSVTKTQVGLSSVDNTSDLNKPISTATQTALNSKENTSNKSTSTSLGTSDTLYPTQNAVKTYVDSSVSSSTPDATTLIKGKLKLAGDLSGTADLPTVPGLATKEPTITAGTTSQYFRGDKTFQTLDKAAVGLSNVDNTSDANKPISSATQTALNAKYDASNPSGYVNSVEAAAAAPVQSVAGKAGIVLLTKSDVGLSNVDNTSDANKPISTATQTALNAKANTSHTHVSSDITDLSEAIDDRISSTIVAGTNVTVSYDDLANTLTISAAGGGSGGATTLDGLTDVSTPSPSNGQALIYNTSTSQWEAQTISSGSGATDLNGLNDVTLSGTLDNQILRYDLASTQWKNETLTKDDIGLSNVDNTSDANKPVSSDTQTALDGKASSIHTHVSTDVTDFSEAVDDRVSSLLVAGSNITLSYDDLANTISISSSGAPASTSAERLITTVFNATGSVIPKMSAIYINGIQGDRPKIVLAQANVEATSSRTYGLVQTDISNMSDGIIVEQGRLENLNTDVVGWVEGDALWLSPTIAGGVTNVKPSGPNHAVFIGYLIRKHQNVGVIQVSIQNGYELQELHNVGINGNGPLLDNQVLKYDAPNLLWKNETLVKADVGLDQVDNTSDANKPISTATQTALDLITDVNWTGDYNNGITYTVGDAVMFNGASFRMISFIGAGGYPPPSYPGSWLQVTEYVSPNDIGLGNVDNTSDANKPVSSATQTALDGKANSVHTHVAADITDFSESVDGRVSNLLVSGSGISLTYNDLGNTLTIASSVSPVPVLTKGGLLTSDGTQNGELTVGTTGQILSADSSEPSGLKWVAAGSGSAKYVRGFNFSGTVTSGVTGVPVVITSAATINKVKVYGVGISGSWTFDLYKNGSGIPLHSIAISSSNVVSITSTEGVLENDVITCVVSAVGAAGTDFSITLELA